MPPKRVIKLTTSEPMRKTRKQVSNVKNPTSLCDQAIQLPHVAASHHSHPPAVASHQSTSHPPAAATHDLASPAAASHHSAFQPPSTASHDSTAQPSHSPTQQAPMNPEDVPTHSPSTQTSSGSVLCFLSFNLSHLFSHVLCILDRITVQKLILELIIFVCYVLGS